MNGFVSVTTALQFLAAAYVVSGIIVILFSKIYLEIIEMIEGR